MFCFFLGSFFLNVCFATQLPQEPVGNLSSLQSDENTAVSYSPNMKDGSPRFIDDSTHMKNLVCIFFFGSCIDCFAGLKESCVETLLCCPFKNAPSVVLDPLCTLYWCCTFDSTPPRMKRSLNVLVTDCKGKPFFYRRAGSTDGCCCPSEEFKKEDEKELAAFYALRQTQMKQMT